MMQKALLCAIVVSFCRTHVTAAADASFVEKQFSRVDSSLARCAALPEARMKEVAPFDGTARQVLASCPEIVSVIRTNSKGTIVNSVRRANGENDPRADASGREWYTAPKSTMTPYYGPLRKENRRWYFVWSRPLSISTAAFGRRFGGVIAVTVDVTGCFSRFAAAVHGPFQVLLDGKSFYYLSWNDGLAFDESPISVPGNLHFSLKLPKKSLTATETAPAGGKAVREKTASPVPESNEASRKIASRGENSDVVEPSAPDSALVETGMTQPAHAARQTGGTLSVIFRIGSAVAVVIVIFCLWLIISTVRKRRTVLQSLGAGIAAPSSDGPAPVLDAPAPPPDHAPSSEIVKSEDEQPAELRPAYMDIPSFVPGVSSPSVPDAEAPAAPLGQAIELPPEDVAAGQETPGFADVAAEMRAEITEEQKDEIYRKELETMTAAIRLQLIDKEMAGLIEKLRRQFAEEMRTKVAGEESAQLAAEVREKLKDEIRAAIRSGEEETLRAQAKEALEAEIRGELLEKEKDAISKEQREKFAAELYNDVSNNQRDAIRESVVEKITEEEHRRIEGGLRETIIEDEKNRIIAEESPDLREAIRKQIRDEELEAMRRAVKDEIYSETVQAIKENLEEKYRTVVQEKIAELRVSLQKKMRSDIGVSIREDYDRLMEQSERLSASLTNIEALQSLSQTIALLTDEKKKYKYLNLNAAQTESLLEYLKRVHNRFNIFFDKVDESVRELMLNLGSVKNKIENKEQ
jgi:hypothetical protein